MTTTAAESLLTAREAKHREAKRTAWNNYRRLLKTLHAGGAVDPDDVGDILSAVDKSDEDLAKDIEMFGQRVKWAEKVAAVAEAQAEHAAIEKEIADYEKEIADLRAKLFPKIEHARTRQAALMGFYHQVEGARTRLIETVLDGLLVEEKAHLENELEPIHRRFAALNARLHTPPFVDDNPEERRTLAAAIAELEARAAELQQRRLEP